MDLYQGTINVETLGINNIEYIYQLENKYFAFYRNRMFIMNTTHTNIEYDFLIVETFVNANDIIASIFGFLSSELFVITLVIVDDD